MAEENDLVAYVLAPDPAFHWTRLSAVRVGAGTLHDLRLVSQIWQGGEWVHRLHLYLPDRITARGRAFLTIGADHAGRTRDTPVDTELACGAGVAGAHLFDVPNQPLFDGLREDELLAHSLSRCLDTEDRTWPVLFPMVKAAVRAMDTISLVCAEAGLGTITQFVVHGASKRAWTTWLAAVVDARVSAIVPEVYDNLNLFAQMPHQVKVWDAYSEMIGDYTEHRLQDKMRTPRGHEIALTIDPFTYRQRLTLPKLLIQSLNDRYWATDALNLYWDDLAGEKHVLYVPNQPHHITERDRVRPTLAAFLRAVLCGDSLPEVTAEYTESAEALSVAAICSEQGIEGRIWSAWSATQDFRASPWDWTAMEFDTRENAFLGSVARPASGYTAVLAECLLPGAPEPFRLSTQVRILSSIRAEA